MRDGGLLVAGLDLDRRGALGGAPVQGHLDGSSHTDEVAGLHGFLPLILVHREGVALLEVAKRLLGIALQIVVEAASQDDDLRLLELLPVDGALSRPGEGVEGPPGGVVTAARGARGACTTRQNHEDQGYRQTFGHGVPSLRLAAVGETLANSDILASAEISLTRRVNNL